MRHQLNRLSAAVYVKALLLAQNTKATLQELKDDQRGLSGIVVAVLLILVAVLAVVILWDSLKLWLEETWQSIIRKGGEIS